MRYVLALLVSVSVMGADFEQSVTTIANTPATFSIKGFNEGRGLILGSASPNSFYKVRTSWTGANWSTASLVQVDANGLELASATIPLSGATQASPFGQAYLAWTGEQNGNSIRGVFDGNVNAVVTTQSTGTLSFAASYVATDFAGPQAIYTPAQGFVGADSFVITYRAGMTDIRSIQVNITITNTAPAISLSASPSVVLEGGSTSFLATTTDANGHTVSVSYDYGDGNTGTSTEHVYAAAGVYTVTATANDGFGGTATAQTTVTVVGQSHIPKARIQTSDIVAFVNTPFTVDGTASTDEQNQPLSFSWNFGDDTQLGSGAVLSHIYTSEGTRTLTLTVTDSEGFTNTATMEIEVLAESAAATFDSEIRVTSTYYPLKQNRDIVQVFARVNIGDAKLKDGDNVALEYAGKRYTATLNKRLKAVGWTVKQNLRRQPFGTVEVSFKARNTAIAGLLSDLGAANDAELDVPFKLELGSKSVLTNVPTLFDVGVARGKANGEL